jgi:murein L,D-transpeptidase YcbB/YkuD
MQKKRIYTSKRMGNHCFVHAALWSTISVILICCHPLTNRTQVETHGIDSLVLMDSAQENYSNLFAGSAAFTFYKSRSFVPVWLKNKTTTILADSMIHLIRSARIFGLLPQDYHLNEIETLFKTEQTVNENSRIQKLDLLLTDAFLTMAMHLKKGRIDINTFERIIHEDDGSQIMSLQAAINNKGIKKMLELHEPATIQYQQLRSALRVILDSADSVERNLLFAGNTIDSLEVSAKVATLEVNLERLRREGRFSGRYILVNIPAFKLSIMEDDEPVFESKVIVGTTKNQTPLLDALIKSFTLYPYWQVPRRIAVNEILPHVKEDSTYLDAHQYEVIDIDGNLLDPFSLNWTSFDSNNFPVIIRQRQGSRNALGVVKYSFNNTYGVYLHDTNAPRLFRKDKRSFSHGCVRVEKAKELSYFLLERDSGDVYTEDLDQYYQLQKRLDIKLKKPISLHIRYLTNEYREGELLFYDDIYNLDKRIHQALYTKKSGAEIPDVVLARQ